jgi:transposase
VVTVIGIDAHSQVHSAAAVDTHGRPIGQLGVGADAAELGRLLGWITSFEGERLIAVEGAKGFGLALTRLLLEAGEQVVDVATHLTAESRKRSRRRGKNDQIDAVAIARAALREPGLPRMDQAHLDAHLKLLVDARDQLVAEQCRVRNRLHALLGAIAPGYREHTGALITAPALGRARSLTLKARSLDPVRAKLALAAIRRLRALDQEIADLERHITAQVRRRNPTHLLAIPGVGMLVAGKLLGETRDIRHFPSAAAFAAYAGAAPVPASSGNTTRHRLARGGNRQLNRALFTIAMVQARWHPQAQAYLARKRAEGKTPAEARRCLKRHLATAVYKAMLRDLAPPEDSAPSLAV